MKMKTTSTRLITEMLRLAVERLREKKLKKADVEAGERKQRDCYDEGRGSVKRRRMKKTNRRRRMKKEVSRLLLLGSLMGKKRRLLIWFLSVCVRRNSCLSKQIQV